jgi:hypothetical protein
MVPAAMNPIERMRQVADLLIGQRKFRESYTVYDELYRQMWSVFGTVQADLLTSSGMMFSSTTSSDPHARRYYPEPNASMMCTRMYGINLTLALDEFIRILIGHLQCVSNSREVCADTVHENILSEFLMLYLLALQSPNQRKITPIFSIVTATVDRDHRFRRIRSNYPRTVLERLLLENAQKTKDGDWRSITSLLYDYLVLTGERQSDFSLKIAAIIGPFAHRAHYRNHQYDRQERQQRSERSEGYERREQKTTSGRRRFDASTATDEEKNLHYGRLFGLSGRVTKAQIRAQYIQSVALYHPDRVQHLGPELKALAEEKTKELNAAYDWLKEKYQI